MNVLEHWKGAKIVPVFKKGKKEDRCVMTRDVIDIFLMGIIFLLNIYSFEVHLSKMCMCILSA